MKLPSTRGVLMRMRPKVSNCASVGLISVAILPDTVEVSVDEEMLPVMVTAIGTAMGVVNGTLVSFC